MCTRDAAPGARARDRRQRASCPSRCRGVAACGPRGPRQPVDPRQPDPRFSRRFSLSPLSARGRRAHRAPRPRPRAGRSRRGPDRDAARARAAARRPALRCRFVRPAGRGGAAAGGGGCGASARPMMQLFAGSLRALRKIQDDVTGDVSGIGTTLPPPRGRLGHRHRGLPDEPHARRGRPAFKAEWRIVFIRNRDDITD